MSSARPARRAFCVTTSMNLKTMCYGAKSGTPATPLQGGVTLEKATSLRQRAGSWGRLGLRVQVASPWGRG